MGLRLKIIIPVLLLLFATVAAVTILNIYSTRSTIYSIIDENMDTNLTTLASQLKFSEDIEAFFINYMSEKNLSLARAAAEIVSLDEEALQHQRMVDMVALLGVDEIHVMNEDGLLLWGSEDFMYGYDFHDDPQTQAFLPIIEDHTLEISQPLTERGLDKVLFQYNGVARKGSPGIVQVGIEAQVVKEIEEMLNIQNLIENMGIGKTGFASVIKGGTVVYHRDRGQIGRNVEAMEWYAHVDSGTGKRWVCFDDGADYYTGYTQKNGFTLVLQFPRQEFNSYLWTMLKQGIAFSIGALILMSGMLVLIIHWFLKPLRQLSQNLGQVAQGNLDIDMANNQQDEIGRLSRDMSQVVNIFHFLLTDIHRMAVKNKEEGDMDYRIDTTRYSGGFKSVTQRINNMVQLQSEDIMALLNVMEHFAAGDFKVDMPAYPGKKAVVNQIVESIGDEIANVIHDIWVLSKAAAEGDLSRTVDISGYKGDWAVVMAGVNEMFASFSAPLNAASAGLLSMAKGKLSVKIENNFTGDYRVIQDSFNATQDALSSYIQEISRLLKAMSKGNYNLTVNGEFLGDFVEIKDSFQTIIVTLNQTLDNINASAGQIAFSSEAIAQTSTALSQRAMTQSENLDMLNEKVMEIDMAMEQNGASTGEISHLVIDMRDRAVKSSMEMQQMLLSIEEMEKASDNISNIINVIEGIAFRTNLLALNASVEAARAGEQGRGFSVVAEEVRLLAARAQTAARQSAQMIEDSIEKAANGFKITQSTVASMSAMAQDVLNISAYMDEIVGSSQKQQDAVRKIKDALSSAQEITRDNGAMAENMATASQELFGTSCLFNETLAAFQLKA